MLPSKGFFTNLNCPFNEHDVCNRPHCHYRHFKKKKHKAESSNGTVSSMLGNYSTDDVNSLLFTEIISEAVQNLFNKSENSLAGKENEQEACDAVAPSQIEPAPVPTYKPTPISELSRRHLPTLYVPSRAEPRKIQSDGTERPAKKKRVAEYKPKASKKSSDQPVPEYCPSTLTLPESQLSALAEELSFLDNIFDEKGLIENEVLNVESQIKKLEEERNATASKSFNPQFSSDDEPAIESDIEDVELAVPTGSVEPAAVANSTDIHSGETFEEKLSDVEMVELDIGKVKKEKDEMKPENENEKEVSTIVKKEDDKNSSKKDDSSSKRSSHRSSHSKSKHSSSSRSHRSSEKKSSDKKSSHSSSIRHKSSSKSKEEKSKSSSSSSKSSHHKTSSSSSKKHSNSKDKHSSSNSSRSKSSKSNKKSSSSSRDKKSYEKHVCNCKYCPKSKKNKKHSESEEDLSNSASENEDSSSDSVIYCSPVQPKVENIDIISSSDEEIEEKSSKNQSDSDSPLDMDFDAFPDISDEHESDNEEDSLAKKVLAKFKKANYQPSSTNVEQSSGSKKRIAHDSIANSSTSWPQNNYNAPKIEKKNVSLTPAQLMAQRWEKIKQLKNAATSNQTGAQPVIPGKVRIAHVPYVSSLMERKKELIEQRLKPPTVEKAHFSKNSPSKSGENQSQSNKLTAQEVFALLKTQLTGNYEKLTERENKVGVEALTLAFSWLYNIEEAREKAIELEKSVSSAAHQIITYRRTLFLKIKSIADQAKDVEKNGRSAILTFNTYNFTYGHNLYLCFAKYLLDEENLEMYGYPRPHSNSGCAFISENVIRKEPQFFEDNKRVCEKCAENYTVNEDGYPIEGVGKCIYHARKGYIRNRTNRHIEDTRHKCCRQEKGSPGCITSKFHASNNVDSSCLTGYIVFDDPPDDGEKENNVYALDCEMIFTTEGKELARLTIVDVKMRTTFDQLIKPKGQVLDCITQWSGITESDLKSATVSFKEVQRYLKRTFNSKTILVGHGLENDLRSLKVLHDKIVDTSVVYPHKYAPQMKESLQRLAEQFLQKLIQTGEETLGHSSEEDARTCMELMLLKIKEDCKQYAPKKVVNLNISRK